MIITMIIIMMIIIMMTIVCVFFCSHFFRSVLQFFVVACRNVKEKRESKAKQRIVDEQTNKQTKKW